MRQATPMAAVSTRVAPVSGGLIIPPGQNIVTPGAAATNQSEEQEPC